eukprot:CAMPEP_0198267664 /NCGR_PEP_ID=MMETSP1447-20131203/33993_1 /TAXON_ID=420782 /ORGANISM="Chaetoceros dichaeta, Strain CCMP1751" /LENGTH=40 /DNA_ID= /DNA_START= /DNA_END= /DNA_ORIENTATION=
MKMTTTDDSPSSESTLSSRTSAVAAAVTDGVAAEVDVELG